jgi:hypothetical protein
MEASEQRGKSAPSTPTAENAPGLKQSDPAGATVPAPPFEERPELYVGAAFAGGLVLAGLLRWIGR